MEKGVSASSSTQSNTPAKSMMAYWANGAHRGSLHGTGCGGGPDRRRSRRRRITRPELGTAARDLRMDGQTHSGGLRLRQLAATAITASAAVDSSLHAADLRADLSVWVAGHHVGNAAIAGFLLLLPAAAGLRWRRCEISPCLALLHPVRLGHAAGGLAGPTTILEEFKAPAATPKWPPRS